MSQPTASERESQNEVYRELQSVIEDECSKTSFACGGSISISRDCDVTQKVHTQSSDPVSIFWLSSNDNGGVRYVALPPKLTPDPNSPSIEELASDCTTASFGRGGEDVIDPEYRRAGKMDTTQFASSFHPADFGLLENIEQILLPEFEGKPEDHTCSRKLVADLYKLNVYSGPSGHFRNHVDTPRSSTQIGSLVVCLPSEFEGGNLLVRHRGQEMDFDWSPAAKSTIQWAAFYSDCEHEIKMVNKGSRITLTYNLHLMDVIGGTIRLPKQIVDPQSLPPYNLIKSLLEQPEFMAEGGKLGVYCSHAYAHASDSASQCLPRNLKGSDITVYSIFKHLGYQVDVLPVLQNPYYEYWEEAEELSEEETDETYKADCEKYRATLKGTIQKVGTKLHCREAIYDPPEDFSGERKKLSDIWPHHDMKDIVWLSSPKHGEVALTHIACGNEATLAFKYSYAAILVTIPPRGDELRAQSKRRKVK